MNWMKCQDEWNEHKKEENMFWENPKHFLNIKSKVNLLRYRSKCITLFLNFTFQFIEVIFKWFEGTFKQFQQENDDERRGLPGSNGKHDIVFSLSGCSIQKFRGWGQ